MGLYVIIMGVQGAGKGMQAAVISKKYNIPHISTGDLFRAMRSRQDDLALKIQDIMKRGLLVDDATTNEVLLDRLHQPDAQNGVILDGYPRNPAQAEWLENYLTGKGEKLAGVLLLDLDLHTAFKRAFGRVSDAQGNSYNIFYNADGITSKFFEHETKEYPPRLEATLTATGEKLLQRPDDANASSIIKRIDTYLAETKPLIEYYKAKGLLKTIEADQSIQAVSDEIIKAIETSK